MCAHSIHSTRTCRCHHASCVAGGALAGAAAKGGATGATATGHRPAERRAAALAGALGHSDRTPSSASGGAAAFVANPIAASWANRLGRRGPAPPVFWGRPLTGARCAVTWAACRPVWRRSCGPRRRRRRGHRCGRRRRRRPGGKLLGKRRRRRRRRRRGVRRPGRRRRRRRRRGRGTLCGCRRVSMPRSAATLICISNWVTAVGGRDREKCSDRLG